MYISGWSVWSTGLRFDYQLQSCEQVTHKETEAVTTEAGVQ